MSEAFYANMRNTAGDLITRFGKDVILRVQATTTPVKDYRPVVTATDYTVQAVATEFNAREINGTTVQSGDRRYLVAAEGMTATPTPEDRLVDGSAILEIRSVRRVSPAGTQVIYSIHTRPTGGGS